MTASQRTRRLGFYLSAWASLLRHAAHFTGDRTVAEDLVQDAWLRFDAAAPAMSLRESIAYLHAVIRNLAHDRKRRRKSWQTLFRDDARRDVENAVSSEPSPEARLIAADDLRVVREMLAAMPPRMRRAVEMHRIEGRTLKAIGAALGLSTSTVHGLVAEGLARCRAALIDMSER